MNIYLVIILIALVGEFALRSIARHLNLKALDPKLPKEFEGFYDGDQYRQSQEYTRAGAKFAYVSSTFDLCLILAFILFEKSVCFQPRQFDTAPSDCLSQLQPPTGASTYRSFAPIRKHVVIDTQTCVI